MVETSYISPCSGGSRTDLSSAMAAILDHFSDRLKAGAKSDLLALSKITFIKSRTARVFYDNGFKSVAAIANTDPKELLPVLMQVSDILV